MVTYQHCGERKCYTSIQPMEGFSPISWEFDSKNILNTFLVSCSKPHFVHLFKDVR